jgi:hypothetical protein
VSALSADERAQIIHNRVKVGNQPNEWKALFKPHWAGIAKSSDLLPEIALRAG